MKTIALKSVNSTTKIFTAIIQDNNGDDINFQGEAFDEDYFKDYIERTFPGDKIIEIKENEPDYVQDGMNVYETCL